MKALFKKSLLGMCLAVAAATSQAAVLTASDATFGAYDSARDTRSLIIGSGGTITDVNIGWSIAKCDDPAAGVGATACPSGGEEFAAEIFMYLISPAGTRVDMVWTYSSVPEGVEGGSTKAGGTYDNAASSGGLYTIIYDDEAGGAVGPVLASGSFIPEELLAAFDGEDALGTWILGFGDSIGADPLSYFSSRLEITTDGAAIPEPGSLALLGLGLAGLAASRRRRQ